jgi:hypothetical protein
MGEAYKVGKDCDAYCTRCKMDLGHTIVAMVDGMPVQVKCDTCHSFHKYRRPKNAPKPARPARRRAAEPAGDREAIARTAAAKHPPGAGQAEVARAGRESRREATVLFDRWQGLVGRREVSDSRRYQVREAFGAEELIDHPKFGLGVVIDAPLAGRIRVLFQDGERVLVCAAAPAGPIGQVS